MKTLLKLAALTSAALLASCGDTPEEKSSKISRPESLSCR